MPPQLQVYVNKRQAIGKLIWILIIWTTMVALLCDLISSSNSDRKFIYCFFIAGFSLSFGIRCVSIIKHRILRPNPLYIFCKEGIGDFQSGLGLIEWSDIVKCRTDGNRLHITITNLRKYLHRSFKITKITAESQNAADIMEITIDFKKLSHSSAQVLDFIREHRSEYPLPEDFRIT